MDIPALFDHSPAAFCGLIDISQLEGERGFVVLSKPVAIEIAKGVFAVRSANTTSAPEEVRREASSQLVVNTADVLLVFIGEPPRLAMPTVRTGVDFHRNGGWG